ncbi:metal ABC transporter permease [Candidatus Laterigemmans baculatus]|uniref:metal ABC transporter permease n=1 Tax=Candidatus Laterigemmans baculatus TaxID=2770505 RepID=UPI0013D8E16F|nr:metal ABC transporter permease [Candidatus Laterigemmans baculatus]
MFGIDWLAWELDGWIMLAGILSAVSAALLGNFLVLRKMSMLGDAISHAVLPGLAAAFLISESRSSWPMFLGAVAVGLLTAVFTEWIRGFGKVDEGASMGVVFTSLFALGLVMIVQAADHVDLDPDCVLYGAIEVAALPYDSWSVGGWEVPRVIVVLGCVSLINLLFVCLFFKELKISSFDASLATTSGFPAWLLHYLLMMLVAVTAVASFESVGNILVVAMLVVPPAAAYMLTDRLVLMIGLSVVIGMVAAVTGHLAALTVPGWFGYRSTTTAGMMAVMTGLIFILAAMLGPRHGVLIKFVRRRLLSLRILTEDVIGFLYRIEERGAELKSDRAGIADALIAGPLALRSVLAWLRWRGHIRSEKQGYELTATGVVLARALVRSHRLWEHYLISEAGVGAERLHAKAERLEHFTDRDLQERLSDETSSPETDPHGRPIPPSDH